MIKIAIDPGHGGKDRTNRGPTGYIEADGVLDISIKLRDILTDTGSFDVKLTRDKDMTLGLSERAIIAADWGANMFISQHTNASGQPINTSVRGTEVYTSVALNDELLAALMAKAISAAIGTKNRGAMQRESNKYPGEDYYTVIDTAQDRGIPHVLLIESAFHDNKEDEALLKDEDIRLAIAKAQAAVICKFYKVQTKPIEGWKNEGIEALASEGVINDKELWLAKRDEPMPVWAATLMMDNIMKRGKSVEDTQKGKVYSQD